MVNVRRERVCGPNQTLFVATRCSLAGQGGQAIIRTTAKVWEIAAGDVEAQAVTRFKTIAGGKGRNGHLQPLTIDDVGSRFFFRHRHQGLEKAAR